MTPSGRPNKRGIDWRDPAAKNAARAERRKTRPAPSDFHRGYAYVPQSAHRGTHLTPDEVRDIRRRVKAGESQNAVARAYGLAHGTVSAIIRRKAWSDIRDD